MVTSTKPQREYFRTTEEGCKLNEKIKQHLQAEGWGEKQIFAIHLALEEALTNAIKHGNGFDPRKVVTVEWQLSPLVFEITIADEGDGFDPDALPDPLAPENLERPCGRGVFLIRQYMTEAHWNTCGNSVTMRKLRQ